MSRAWQAGAPRDSRLDREPLPWGAEMLWEWFWELRWAGGSVGLGARPISHGEIKAWADLQGLGLNPWEVHTLRAMDQTFLNFLAEARTRRKGA